MTRGWQSAYLLSDAVYLLWVRQFNYPISIYSNSINIRVRNRFAMANAKCQSNATAREHRAQKTHFSCRHTIRNIFFCCCFFAEMGHRRTGLEMEMKRKPDWGNVVFISFDSFSRSQSRGCECVCVWNFYCFDAQPVNEGGSETKTYKYTDRMILKI